MIGVKVSRASKAQTKVLVVQISTDDIERFDKNEIHNRKLAHNCKLSQTRQGLSSASNLREPSKFILPLIWQSTKFYRIIEIDTQVRQTRAGRGKFIHKSFSKLFSASLEPE